MKGKDRKKKDYAQLPIVNEGAAGIDVGASFHMVSIGQKRNKDVRKFGVYTEDLHELASWLIDNDIRTVAMESTGSYWKGLWRILQDYGLEVVLVNGKLWKKEQKSDVLDSMWLQQLHSLGLLKGSYLPDNLTEQLKHYWRHRQQLISNAGDYVRRMQKALRLMNIRLDNVLADVVGASGKAIIEAILAGQRDSGQLIKLVHKNVKKSREEILKALQGDWREEHLFELQQCYEIYQALEQKRLECDERIDQVLNQRVEKSAQQRQLLQDSKAVVKRKRKNKNDPQFNIQHLSYALFDGIDLSAAPGASHGLLLTFLSEVGTTVDAFPSGDHFASWLKLCPNNKVSGGKRISSKARKTNNPLALALRHSANAIGTHDKGPLGSFFKRVAFRSGRQAAIVATARKLAVILWNMISKKQPYQYMENEEYERKLREQKIRIINKQIQRFDLQQQELNFDEIASVA